MDKRTTYLWESFGQMAGGLALGQAQLLDEEVRLHSFQLPGIAECDNGRIRLTQHETVGVSHRLDCVLVHSLGVFLEIFDVVHRDSFSRGRDAATSMPGQ